MKYRFDNTSSADRVAIGVAVVCVAALLAELVWPHPLAQHAETVADAPSAPAAPPPAATPPADYRAIASQPLFTADRRPYQPPPAPKAPEAPVAPRVKFELTAIVSSADAQFALLKTNLLPKIVKVGLNEAIEGWTLVEVRADAVVLRRSDETQVVELPHARRDAVGVAAPSFVRERQ